MFWRDLFDVARDHASTAEQSVIIASPFVKLEPLAALLRAIPPNIDVELTTRWRPEEVARGVSDTEVLGLVEARGGTVWLLDTLHAKMVLADQSRALIGSANITAAGLGLSRNPNFEILTSVEVSASTAAALLHDLRLGAVQATAEIAKSVEDMAALMSVERLPEDPDAQEIEGPNVVWIPRFRSPDRLFDLYNDIEWLSKVKESDGAFLDLQALGLPRSLDRTAFNARVRERLLRCPPVAVLDEALAEPQRFGALTAALRPVTPDLDHNGRQALLQLLLRWMLFFAGDRYRLDTPNYSEIVSKR